METDEEVDDWWRSFWRKIRLGVVRSLLAGNDTQCFTTQQYTDMYHKRCHSNKDWEIMKEMPGILADWESGRVSRNHLESLSDVVREVKPNVWAPI